VTKPDEASRPHYGDSHRSFPKPVLNIGRDSCDVPPLSKDGQGINVILEMSWMKKHKALLDTAARTVQLDSPVHGITVLSGTDAYSKFQ
jgi:hypothetical protein